eukprot:665031-Rhodomonas_salina.1
MSRTLLTVTAIASSATPLTNGNATADNGAVHVIGAVFLPNEAQRTIADFFTRLEGLAGQWTSFMSFYKAAGDEIKTIRSSEDEANAYTLFMPTNTAFGELEQDLYTCLLKPENKERVLELIKYHVVRGTQLSSTGGFAKAYPEADTVPTLATSFDDNSVVFTN